MRERKGGREGERQKKKRRECINAHIQCTCIYERLCANVTSKFTCTYW